MTDIDLNNVYVCDAEFDDLLEGLTKMHVLSVGYRTESGEWDIMSTNDPEKVQKVLGNPENILIFHNGIRYDKRAFEKVGYTVNCTIWDSLAMSWILFPERQRHSVASWAETFDNGVAKVEIEDWKNLSYETYLLRCEVDVKLQVNMWVTYLNTFRELYKNDQEIIKVINYGNFKIDCLRIQEENKIYIDEEKCLKNIGILKRIVEDKVDILKKIMPKVQIKTKRLKPKNMYKKGLTFPGNKMYNKDGNLTKAGEAWHTAIEELGLEPDHTDEIALLSAAGGKWKALMDQIVDPSVDKEQLVEVSEITGTKDPNPNGSSQIKDWLFTLGWKPRLFKDAISSVTGKSKKVPQLKDEDKNLCESVLELKDKIPEIEALEGLSVAAHRLTYLNKFMEIRDEEGYAVARASSLAKTLRLKHAGGFQNLPKPTAKYGEFIRSVMAAPPGKVLIGSDVSSLEDKTKQISIYPYDKEYVDEMNIPGWDAHLDIGKRARLLTDGEVAFYRWYKKYSKSKGRGKEVEALIGDLLSNSLLEDWHKMNEEEWLNSFELFSKKRAVAKTVNYAATYGAGAAKIATAAGISVSEGRGIIKAYWERNWSVKKYAADRETKTISDGRTFIYNPISELWLLLSSDHLRFSVCNQNAGVKIFDTWVFYMIKQGLYPIAQFHDEVLLCVDEDKADEAEAILHECMEKVNKRFNFPIKFEVDVQSGGNYAEVH